MQRYLICFKRLFWTDSVCFIRSYKNFSKHDKYLDFSLRKGTNIDCLVYKPIVGGLIHCAHRMSWGYVVIRINFFAYSNLNHCLQHIWIRIVQIKFNFVCPSSFCPING